MVYCEEEPYWKNSNEYFLKHTPHYDYWTWMLETYRTVLVGKDGSYSDNRPQHWAFRTDEDRTLFMLRWA